MDKTKGEFVVPHEAAERGSLVVGELKSEQATFPSMLVQFSKVIPSGRKAKIFLYSTLEQAKSLFAMRPPFSFRGHERRGKIGHRRILVLRTFAFREPLHKSAACVILE